MTNGYIQMMRWQQEIRFTTSSQLKSRVRLTVNNVPTHRTHTQVTTKVTKLQLHTQSVSKTVDSTSTQVEWLMAHVATTRSWATTSSQGNDTQPVDGQPHDINDHTFDTTTVGTTTVSTTSNHVQQQFSCQPQGTLRNTNKVGSGTPELLETTFQNGPAIESSQPEIRKSITVHRVTLEQLTRVNVLVSYVYRRERIS